MLDGIAGVNSMLSKDPCSPFIQAAGRGVSSTVVRGILNKHVQTWNTDYFAEKGCNVFLVTGAGLDGLLGLQQQDGSGKAEAYERYARDVKGRALSRDWEELDRLSLARANQPRSTPEAAIVPSRGKYFEKRLAALGALVEPFESEEPASPSFDWLIDMFSTSSLREAGGASGNPRPLSEPAHFGSSWASIDKKSLKQQYKSEKRELEKEERRELKMQYKANKKALKACARVDKRDTRERIARAGCIWIVVLPLA